MNAMVANAVPVRVRRPKLGTSVVLDCVPWSQYLQLLRVFAESPKARLTYDRGRLEIMSPSIEHDYQSRDFDSIVIALTQAYGLNCRHGGSVTIKQRSKRRGIEPDECFWIANAAKIAGKMRLDLRHDPPPDLAVEVDVSRSSMNRLSIYAQLGVPEVWRWQGQTLTFYSLMPDGADYMAVSTSRSFPGLKPEDLLPFLDKFRTTPNIGQVLQELRDWLRLRAVASPNDAKG